MRRLPTSVMIGGKRIRLRIVPELGMHGCYDHDEKLIMLNAALLDDPAALRSTLRHEMLEATLFISGHAWMEGFDTEPLVRAIEEIFFPAIDKVEKHFQ